MLSTLTKEALNPVVTCLNNWIITIELVDWKRTSRQRRVMVNFFRDLNRVVITEEMVLCFFDH